MVGEETFGIYSGTNNAGNATGGAISDQYVLFGGLAPHVVNGL